MKTYFASVILVAACYPSERPTAVQSVRADLTMHLAQDTPAEGMTPMADPSTLKTIYVNPSPALTHEDIRRVLVQRGPSQTWVLAISFTETGSSRLARVTSENVGRRLAFMVDRRILTAPVLQGPITEGAAIIEADMTKEEAERLAKAWSHD